MFPKVMGILNATPDSFSDGIGVVFFEKLFQKATEMINCGVDIIDIGGESTRPGAEDVDAAEELDRILPLIRFVKTHYPETKISVDTRKSEVAEVVLEYGVEIINDVSGLSFSPEMLSVVARFGADLIIVHCQNKPSNMQVAPSYTNVVEEVFSYL